jgi:hypothetical protein
MITDEELEIFTIFQVVFYFTFVVSELKGENITQEFFFSILLMDIDPNTENAYCKLTTLYNKNS